MSTVVNQIIELAKQKDYWGIHDLIEANTDPALIRVKCVTCGKMITIETQSKLLSAAMTGGDKLIEYLILLHLKDNRDHNIVLDAPNWKYPIGKMVFDSLKKTCKIHKCSIDSGFKQRLPYLEEKLGIA